MANMRSAKIFPKPTPASVVGGAVFSEVPIVLIFIVFCPFCVGISYTLHTENAIVNSKTFNSVNITAF